MSGAQELRKVENEQPHQRHHAHLLVNALWALAHLS